ncbi:MAG: nucleotidyl transferase AbiEii/AbiGii toxin family protein [Candidatus Helarchaeota archaeon]
MIDYLQVQRLALKNNVSPEIIEKDYLIELVLFYFSKDSSLCENLVFRGGTALKKVYFPEYRFSEDLDFVIDSKKEINVYQDIIIQILQKISSDYPIKIDKRSIFERDRLQLFIIYDIIPDIRGIKELKVDILQDYYIPKHERKGLLFSYPEFENNNSVLETYALESVVCDKIGRILDVDNEPRDLYDLWYLLKLNLDIKIIMKEFKNKYGYEIIILNLLREIVKDDYRQNWENRLIHQIFNLPDF